PRRVHAAQRPDSAGSAEPGVCRGGPHRQPGRGVATGPACRCDVRAGPAGSLGSAGMLDRIGAIGRQEIQHLFAPPKIPMFILLVPVANLLVFAYAINTVVDDLPTVVYDASADSDSRAFVSALRASGFFHIRRYVSSREEAVAAVDAGEARVAVVLPPE